MPPVAVLPATWPSAVQPETWPVSRFMPTTPPTWPSPCTTPRKVQFCTAPWLTPTMPPTWQALPDGATVPATVRSRTTAPSCRMRKRPMEEPLSATRRPEMVWPCPSKTPQKMGNGVKLSPFKSRSAVRTIVRPLDQLSSEHCLAARSSSSTEDTFTVAPSAARAVGRLPSSRSAASSRAHQRCPIVFSMAQSPPFRDLPRLLPSPPPGLCPPAVRPRPPRRR